MTLHLAGRKEPNDWGLYDMSGSVWEWVHDWYEGDLGSDPVTDPAGAEQPTLGRVLRGGSCQVEAQYLRSASRYTSASPSVRIPLHGFRCVITSE
jgi:formylglycine-generating enzyme required for sulfatase activity